MRYMCRWVVAGLLGVRRLGFEGGYREVVVAMIVLLTVAAVIPLIVVMIAPLIAAVIPSTAVVTVPLIAAVIPSTAVMIAPLIAAALKTPAHYHSMTDC